MKASDWVPDDDCRSKLNRGAFVRADPSAPLVSLPLFCPADRGSWISLSVLDRHKADLRLMVTSALRTLSCFSCLAILASFPSHKWHKYALGPFNSASLRELAPGTSDVSSSRTPRAIAIERLQLRHGYDVIRTSVWQKLHSGSMAAYRKLLLRAC